MKGEPLRARVEITASWMQKLTEDVLASLGKSFLLKKLPRKYKHILNFGSLISQINT